MPSCGGHSIRTGTAALHLIMPLAHFVPDRRRSVASRSRTARPGSLDGCSSAGAANDFSRQSCRGTGGRSLKSPIYTLIQYYGSDSSYFLDLRQSSVALHAVSLAFFRLGIGIKHAQ